MSSQVPLLTETHGRIHDEVREVAGWLEPGDSLKLYEIGYGAPGPFLEVGTYCGKSTTVLATALRDSGRSVPFYSLDIDHLALDSARSTLEERGLGSYVTLVHGTLQALFWILPDYRPRFVFLDGNHSEAGLGRDLAALESRVPEGGLLLFHDFVDERNDDPRNRDYGVPQAVRGSWVSRDCEFEGTFGCAGLYRVRSAAGAPPREGDTSLLELIRLDRPAVRLRVEVVRPLLRWWRRLRGRPTGLSGPRRP